MRERGKEGTLTDGVNDLMDHLLAKLKLALAVAPGTSAPATTTGMADILCDHGYALGVALETLAVPAVHVLLVIGVVFIGIIIKR